MVILKRRTLVIISLVVLLALTGYLNYYYNQHFSGSNVVQTSSSDKANKAAQPAGENKADTTISTTDQNKDIQVEDVSGDTSSLEQQAITSTSSASTFFIEYRLEREKVRSQEIDTLKEIVENTNMDKDSKAEAVKTLSQLVQTNETEMAIENLIKAKGFKDALAFVHEDSTNIIVYTPEKLTPAQVAMIQDIVMQKTNQSADKIKIIERK